MTIISFHIIIKIDPETFDLNTIEQAMRDAEELLLDYQLIFEIIRIIFDNIS